MCSGFIQKTMKKYFIPAMAVAMLFSSCAQEDGQKKEDTKTLIQALEVVRDGENNYTVTAHQSGNWQLYQANAEASINFSAPLASLPSDSSVSFVNPLEGRLFIGAVSDQGDTLLVTERHIVMDGPVNFRDIGGIQNKAGKTVKWGMIYRSDKLSEVSEADQLKMTALNLQTIVDFRNKVEVSEEPDVYPEAIHHVSLQIGDTSWNKKDMKQMLKVLKTNPDTADYFMSDLYARIPVEWDYQYKAFFDLLTDSTKANTPLLYHCTAGKDRTGIATALVFYVLGVDFELIKKEYTMSNYYRFEENRTNHTALKVYGIDESVAPKLLGVEAQYMDNIFAHIAEVYGSVDQYIEETLGVDSVDQAYMRATYLY